MIPPTCSLVRRWFGVRDNEWVEAGKANTKAICASGADYFGSGTGFRLQPRQGRTLEHPKDHVGRSLPGAIYILDYQQSEKAQLYYVAGAANGCILPGP